MNIILEQYSDYKHIGNWGVFDTKSMKFVVKGTSFSRTIKLKKSDGSVGLDTQWITDEEMRREIWE